MDSSIFEALSRVCSDCQLDGGCCSGAMPPLSSERIAVLLAGGVKSEDIEYGKYKHLKLKPDGFCVLFKNGKCSIHAIKPETCVAGPFTFDVKGRVLEIFLKKESICPMVRFLKENKSLYDSLFDVSVTKIIELIDRLPADELSEILKIEEPETELVAEIMLKKPYCE